MSAFYMMDIFPILAIIALIIAFAVKNKAMKKEEEDLIETLKSLSTKESANENK